MKRTPEDIGLAVRDDFDPRDPSQHDGVTQILRRHVGGLQGRFRRAPKKGLPQSSHRRLVIATFGLSHGSIPDEIQQPLGQLAADVIAALATDLGATVRSALGN